MASSRLSTVATGWFGFKSQSPSRTNAALRVQGGVHAHVQPLCHVSLSTPAVLSLVASTAVRVISFKLLKLKLKLMKYFKACK